MARAAGHRRCAIVLVIVAAAFAPASEGYYLNIVMQAATYAIAVAGLVVVLGYCGQISLAQAGFLGIGAYCVAHRHGRHAHLPFLALAGAAVITGLFGLASSASPACAWSATYLAMVTISFQQILTLVLTNWIGLTHGPDGVSGIPRPALLQSGQAYLGLCLVPALVLHDLLHLAAEDRAGSGARCRRCATTRSPPAPAASTRSASRVVAFGISAMLGGIGGGLFAGAFAYISPDQFSFDESIVLLTMALLGGVQSPFGALLGTCVLVILPEWLRFLRQAYLAVYGAAVILIMIFLPDGVVGHGHGQAA